MNLLETQHNKKISFKMKKKYINEKKIYTTLSGQFQNEIEKSYKQVKYR